MATPVNPLDELVNQLHNDSVGRLDDQLISIERELLRRRLLSAEASTSLFDQIRSLSDEIMRLLPEHEHAIDHHKTIRQGLERERRELHRLLHEELLDRWRDVQALRKEHRDLLAQRRERQDRYELLNTGYE